MNCHGVISPNKRHVDRLPRRLASGPGLGRGHGMELMPTKIPPLCLGWRLIRKERTIKAGR
eukprot:1392243-Amorphochlora_amoeboformis.AAC.1